MNPFNSTRLYPKAATLALFTALVYRRRLIEHNLLIRQPLGKYYIICGSKYMSSYKIFMDWHLKIVLDAPAASSELDLTLATNVEAQQRERERFGMKVVKKEIAVIEPKKPSILDHEIIRFPIWPSLATMHRFAAMGCPAADEFERWVAPCWQVERHTIHWVAPIPAMLGLELSPWFPNKLASPQDLWVGWLRCCSLSCATAWGFLASPWFFSHDGLLLLVLWFVWVLVVATASACCCDVSVLSSPNFLNVFFLKFRGGP